MNSLKLFGAAAVLSAFAASAPAATTFTFNATGAFQTWTAPAAGKYIFTAYGAQGGTGALGSAGGLGVKTAGQFKLKKGQSLSIAVGVAGGNVPGFGPSANGSGGGGGGSFVMLNLAAGGQQLLLAAGGGGGGGSSAKGVRTVVIGHDASGFDGVTTGYGANGDEFGVGGAAGLGGGGGYGPVYDKFGGFLFNNPGGAGGGGYYTIGDNGGPTGAAVGGGSLFYGFYGGAPDTYGISGQGGFGGGGGGGIYGGGGGGGYGGGGGGSVAYYYDDQSGYFIYPGGGAGGGGGGSFDAGSNAVLAAGVNAGDGLVSLVHYVRPPAAATNTLTSSVPEPAAWAIMLVGLGFCGLALRRRRETLVTGAAA